MGEDNNMIQRNLWETPWGYVESFFVGFGLILTGFCLEVFVGSNELMIMSFPTNLYFLLSYVLVLFAGYKWFSHIQLIRWLSKVPASISSIALVTLLVMIMGIIPQVPSENPIVSRFGLNHMTQNWAFILILFQFLTCLGLVTIKRLLQFDWSNLGFILNHLGLFIALIAGVLGVGDLQRVTVDLYENKPSWIARDINNKSIELPFAFYLNDFLIEEYNPKIALVDNQTGSIAHNNGKNLYLVSKEENYFFKNYRVEVKDYLPSAGRVLDRYLKVNEVGSPPAAYLEVRDTEKDTIINGWISSGSFRSPYESLKISDDYSLVMTIPEVKKFSSDIDILTKEGERIKTVLEVNQPFQFEGWEIYQLSYDDKMGKWSQLSVIELVRDPWLPVIYFGVFMMIFGAVYMFWMGSKTKKETA